MGYTINIAQADNLKRIRKFINKNGQIQDGGAEENLGNTAGGAEASAGVPTPSTGSGKDKKV
jgi:hypothetical protein